MQERRRRTKLVRKTDKITRSLVFSYKDLPLLQRYMTEQGYIVPRTKTGISQKQQRRLAKAVKQARHLALLPFTQTL